MIMPQRGLSEIISFGAIYSPLKVAIGPGAPWFCAEGRSAVEEFLAQIGIKVQSANFHPNSRYKCPQ